ncbi:MAG TPA: hypothetical protein VMG10_00580 [Gemmataceae bacterium]|nr:hypothetical protein [Gemmataceae bacterium]
MNGNNRTIRDQETTLESLAAELTEAAYLVALRHGVAGSWVDLELDLWQVLGSSVQKWGRQLPPCR